MRTIQGGVAAGIWVAASQQVENQWQKWKAQQHLTGPDAVPHYANPADNHFTWYATHGWTTPYPGEFQIYAPDQVPGAYLASSDSEG